MPASVGYGPGGFASLAACAVPRARSLQAEGALLPGRAHAVRAVGVPVRRARTWATSNALTGLVLKRTTSTSSSASRLPYGWRPVVAAT